LIKKIYLPREFLAILCMLAAFLNLPVTAVIYLGSMLYYHVSFTENTSYGLPSSKDT